MRCDMELIHREGCISWQTLLLKCTECSMICVRFNGYLSDGTGLAGTRKKLFWILLQQRTTEVEVATKAIRCATLQSNCHHQQTNTQVFTGRMPFLSSNQQCRSTEGNTESSMCLRLLPLPSQHWSLTLRKYPLNYNYLTNLSVIVTLA